MSTYARASLKIICSPGRHGLFSCYEAFIHIVDTMFNQHAKKLKTPGTFLGGNRSLRSTTADLAGVTAGSQWVFPSGSRLHRSCRQQKLRYCSNLSSARRQLPAVCSRSLFEVGITGLKTSPAHCRGQHDRAMGKTEPWHKGSTWHFLEYPASLLLVLGFPLRSKSVRASHLPEIAPS